jgi:hypothetical protein
MHLNAVTTPRKKPKAYRTEFADAHRACKTPTEREQLAAVVRAGWTEAELQEYARLFFFPNNKDYPTALSYRRAIKDIAGCTRWPEMRKDPPSYAHPCSWLKLFRKGKSKPVPPRREGLLLRGRGLSGFRVSCEEYSWPGHSEEYRSMIEQRARDYFKIPPDKPLHVNAWAASQRWYDREQQALRIATEAITFSLSPKSLKKSTTKASRRKIVSSFEYPQGPLKPHFGYYFAGHTDAFREEVAVWARKDNRLRPNAYISPRRWKVACHKHYVLTTA